MRVDDFFFWGVILENDLEIVRKVEKVFMVGWVFVYL